MRFARTDGRPARRAIYLTPLLKLHRDCSDGSVPAVTGVVAGLADDLGVLKTLPSRVAVAEAAIAASVGPGSNCTAEADAIDAEVTGHLHWSGGLSAGVVRFSPPLSAELALAAIQHSLLPGRVRVVYALKAFSCQQAVFMGPALGRRYGNADLGAFIELTSGHGVGHGKYDANRVNRARVTPLGRIGGQPCT
ncbi:MAG TPA: hypothetical protein VG650_14155 [Mycobacteriales bacterium]|nr:hypothetical protein [Mycobacteriales bacterium]